MTARKVITTITRTTARSIGSEAMQVLQEYFKPFGIQVSAKSGSFKANLSA